jgi:predicted RNA-binding protein YlqC (UPF0109 family)
VSVLRDLVETTARGLADNPQRVRVTEVELRGMTLIEVTVAPSDVGKLIGRQGRTIAAMRTLATIAADRLGKKITVEVRDSV